MVTRKYPGTPGGDYKVRLEITVRADCSREHLQREFELWLRGREPWITVDDDGLLGVLVLEAPVIEVTS